MKFSVPFNFPFPRHASCCSGKAKAGCLLPPTLDMCSGGLKARVTYSVKVLVHRRGLFKRSLKAKQHLKYQPAALDPPAQVCAESGCSRCPEFIHSTAMLPASRLGWRNSTAAPSLPGPECLPMYSPALMLEVLMPYPGILCVGRKTKLQIFVHTSGELLVAVEPLQLRSVTVRLRTSTTSRAGSAAAAARTDVSYRLTWHSTGVVPLVQEKLMVDCGVWQDGGVPSMRSSFRSCAVSQTHAVEVMLGIASQRQPQTQVRYSRPGAAVILQVASLTHAAVRCYVCQCRRYGSPARLRRTGLQAIECDR